MHSFWNGYRKTSMVSRQLQAYHQRFPVISIRERLNIWTYSTAWKQVCCHSCLETRDFKPEIFKSRGETFEFGTKVSSREM